MKTYYNDSTDRKVSCSCSVFCTGIIAFCVSWYFNHSILWGILHFFLGILYLAYKAVWYVFIKA